MANAQLLRFELNRSGVGQLLKCKELEDGLKSIVSRMATDCGSGYSYDTKMMGTRVIASVYTETTDAMEDNANNNTILKAVSKARA